MTRPAGGIKGRNRGVRMDIRTALLQVGYECNRDVSAPG